MLYYYQSTLSYSYWTAQDISATVFRIWWLVERRNKEVIFTDVYSLLCNCGRYMTSITVTQYSIPPDLLIINLVKIKIKKKITKFLSTGALKKYTFITV